MRDTSSSHRTVPVGTNIQYVLGTYVREITRTNQKLISAVASSYYPNQL